ncbi:MAG: MG2 domain-containing protein, partial [Ferruginibacter sp.]
MAQWKSVEQLEAKGLTASALKEVVSIFNQAVAENNEAQQIKSAMYQMKFSNMVQLDNKQSNIFYIDTLIAKTKAPARNILQSMQASLFWNYLQMNRYRLYDRTNLAEDKSNDIDTWGIAKITEQIKNLYLASLQNEQLLKTTSISQYDEILNKGKNTRHLRPSLYDFLAHRALDYFMNDEHDLSQPAYKFIIKDEKSFAPVSEFAQQNFATADSASLFYQALLIFKKLLQFHIADADPAALLDTDLKRLDFVNAHGVFSNKEKLYEAALKNVEDKYAKYAPAAQAMYLRARLYADKGESYHPYTNKNVQFELVKAVALAEAAIKTFPQSEGAANAKLLLQGLRTPQIELQTEKVNVPGQPFKTLVTYRNAPALYYRILKVTREQIQQFDQNENNTAWKNIIALQSLKEFTVSLPDQKDYQQHKTEIKIEALPAGTYYLLSSLRSDFSFNNNILARMVTHVTDISYIINNKKELYVLNRDNGQPMAGAEVQLWSIQYNYTNRKYDEIKKENFKTDANGFVQLKQNTNRNNENYNSFLQVKHDNQQLFTSDTYYGYDYYRGPDQQNIRYRTFLFTDRSIYRPGQRIFFKGIVAYTDSAVKNTRVANNYSTKVLLRDANGQTVASLALQTNEYGSYNGSFQLPEGLLNGRFTLLDSINNSLLQINVEAYKRPTFSVTLKMPEGSYRVNDSITVKGNANAYAGNAIDGATVQYRVVRKVVYPIWGSYYRIWPPYNRGTEMEITNGTATTDAKGNFTITFKAISDETLDKKEQPTFYYEVIADVTDINGETRSNTASIPVSYQALKIEIVLPEKILADSLKTIKINSTNINGLHEKALVELSIQKLIPPIKIFRKRYWEVPDQFIMTKEEHDKNFPHDAYKDEDDVSKWPIGEKILQVKDTTSSDGKFTIKNNLPAGWYKITVTTSDKFGENVTAEKIIEITKGTTREPINIAIAPSLAEPGQKVEYTIATGFDNIWLIKQITKPGQSQQKNYQTILSTIPQQNEIVINESDRGSVNISYAFVKHNRVYTGNNVIAVPWSNKELQVSYETFRDKLQPGETEKWKVKITGNKKEKVAAEMLVSMYDASLDQFKPHTWPALQSLWPVNVNTIVWMVNNFAAIDGLQYHNLPNAPISVPEKSYDELLTLGWLDQYYNYGPRQRKLAQGNGRDMEMSAPAMQEAQATNARASK